MTTSSTQGMVERVARAIAKAHPRMGARYPATPEHVAETILMARAAIAAMREPTEAMDIAGTREIDDFTIAECVWRAMIDAALGESP